MLQCDTLIVAGWCIPVDPRNSVLTDSAVAITDGRIVEVLPASEARTKYQPGVLMERPDHVVMPGLVNTHTHAAMTLFRGFADDMPLDTWLQEAIWPAERRWVSAEMVRDGTKLAMAEMLSSGITCFSDQYFFPEIVAESAADAYMRAVVATPVIDFPTPWSASASDCLSRAGDLVHDRYADHPMINTCFAPHSTPVLSDESFAELRVFADQLDCQVQIHLHESEEEIAQSVAETGLRPIERLDKLGLLNSSLLAVHAVHLTNSEIERFSELCISVAHCPRSNLKLADGFARVDDMLSIGVNVSLGTDGAASNNVLDMLGEMRTAALIGKSVARDASALPAIQVIRMATLDGARAIGLSDSIGSIETGKWADLICIDLSPLHSQPVYDPVSQIVYTANADQVTDAWVAGRHLLEASELTHIDTQDVLQRAAEWRQRIVAGSTATGQIT